jgi:two-component system sensor histidine kinase AlgZ
MTLETRRHLLRIALVNTLAGIAATLVYFLFAQRFDVREAGRVLAIALVYSFANGTLAGLAAPVLLRRFNRGSLVARLLAFSGGILAAIALGCLLATAVLDSSGIFPGAWRQFGFILRVSVLLGMALCTGAFFLNNVNLRLEETKARLRTKELEEERANKLAAEARLASLQARVHPHFLFNTLNSIASLIPEDPKRAEQLVNRLSALLRLALDADRQKVIPLDREIKIVRDYLEIERVRCGDRLRYRIDVPPEFGTAEVPLLALQCLVENSVRYGGGEITVSARAGDAGLELEVTDNGPGFRIEDIPSGHAIDNLLSRLEALFNGGAALETTQESGKCTVRIRLPHKVVA